LQVHKKEFAVPRMGATDLIKWSEEFGINIEEVDEQHKVLVGLLNELHRAIREHHGKATLREILGHLAEYTRTHFLLEESLMRLTRYRGLEIHKQQHQDLMLQVEALQHKLDTEDAAISFELLHFLGNWLIQHINDSDRRFGAHFNKAGLAAHAPWSKVTERTVKRKKWWWKLWWLAGWAADNRFSTVRKRSGNAATASCSGIIRVQAC